MSTKAQQVRVEDGTPDAEMPEGWATASFMGIFDIQGGTQPPKEKFVYEPRPGYIRLLQIRDFGEKPVPTYIPFVKTLKTCKRGDVLIGRYGASVGRICTGMEGAYNVALAKVIRPQVFDSKFVIHLLNSHWFQTPILAVERSAQDGFNKDNLAAITLPIPPIEEQHRIVEKVDQGLAKLSITQERLARVPTILRYFRQAVLAAACSGKLTEDWRTEHTHLQHASSLLNSIIAQRKHEWEQLHLFRLESIRKMPSNDKWRTKYSPPTHAQRGDYELPETWTWASVEELAFVMSGNTPKGIESRVRDKGEFPWLKVGDMNDSGNERYMTNAASFLSRSDLEQLRFSALPEGTIIFPKRGGAIATNKKRELTRASCLDLNTMAIVPLREVRPYFWWWFRSVDLNMLSDGSNVPQINHTDINPLPVPLPPLEEQHEIVRRVEALFKLADAIEKRVAAATLRAEKLTQAVLAKAFRGELVPTEAELARREGRDYEPASLLLERIRKAKEKAVEEKLKKGKRVKVAKAMA